MLKNILENLPNNPGVYIFKNEKKEIIYIGKAKNLSKRVKSYFSDSTIKTAKTSVLVTHIKNIEYIIVDNEIEALLLENKLIKTHKPKYNISLKDSKTYAYIQITDENIPKIKLSRINTGKKNDFFIGPFSETITRNQIFDVTVRLFKLITPKTYSSKSTLNYQIERAPSKTINDINIKEYMQNVESAKQFLKGNINPILKKLENRMKDESEKLNFEIAQKLKNDISIIKSLKEKQKVDLKKIYDQDIISGIENQASKKTLIQVLKIKKGLITKKEIYNFDYIKEDLLDEFIKMYYSKNIPPKEILLNSKPQEEKELLEEYISKFSAYKTKIIIPKQGEKHKLILLAQKNAIDSFNEKNILEEMKSNLKLKSVPNIIECFDISNLGYSDIVAGMVQFKNGVENKQEYRRFKIKSFSGYNDDFKAMHEVIYRRYKRIKEEKKNMPDLIIIDGGKGQLNSAKSALKELNLRCDIISIAKKNEEIYTLYSLNPLIFDKNSKMLLLIRHIRNCVHNYVISYNRSKRKIK